MAEALLSVQGLRKHYGGLAVTNDVCLDVQPGEIHALIGPNGAGKTTLVRHLLQNPQGKRLAVIVNEFGVVGVDG